MVAGGHAAAHRGQANAALNAAMKSPEVGKRITDMGAEVQTSTAEQFGTFWGKELQRCKALVKLSGATLE